MTEVIMKDYGNKIEKLSVLKVNDVGYGSLYFTYEGILTKEEAAEMQRERGYHPAGYGFYAHQHRDEKTSWCCSASCE